MQARTEADPESEIDRLESSGTHAFARVDPAYPSRLREIDDAPPVLYVRGTLSPDDDYGVAVVGTRRATAYGRQATAELSRGLAAARPPKRQRQRQASPNSRSTAVHLQHIAGFLGQRQSSGATC